MEHSGFSYGSKASGLSYFPCVGLGAPFGAMIGLFTLIFTVPTMMLKEVSGEFSGSQGTNHSAVGELEGILHKPH
jgi:H+/Cl- antiporter ClcA